MDFSSLVNVGFVGGIIAILQTIKLLDTKKKLASGFYIVSALILGFLGGFLITPYVAPLIQWLQKAAVNGVMYAGSASILFQTGKLVIIPHPEGPRAKFINSSVDKQAENDTSEPPQVGK